MVTNAQTFINPQNYWSNIFKSFAGSSCLLKCDSDWQVVKQSTTLNGDFHSIRSPLPAGVVMELGVIEGVRVRAGFKGQKQRALGKCLQLLLEQKTRDKSGVAPLVLGNNNLTGCEISVAHQG